MLKAHEESFTDNSLQSLLVEVKAFVNSCPLTTETTSDVTSTVPLSPINLLTLKSKIAVQPKDVFYLRIVFEKALEESTTYLQWILKHMEGRSIIRPSIQNKIEQINKISQS